MESQLGNLIKYEVIDSYEKSEIEDFNQFSESSIFYIPNVEDITEITSVCAQIKNISSQMYFTPKGVSYEGQVLCGNSLIICADLKIKLKYVLCKEDKPVESMYLNIPVSTCVTLEEDFDECLTVYPSIVIEDIFCRKLNNSKFYLSAMMIAIVDTF